MKNKMLNVATALLAVLVLFVWFGDKLPAEARVGDFQSMTGRKITPSVDVNLLQKTVNEAYAKGKTIPGGKNADYIPFLAKVPGNLTGLAVVMADGRVFAAGDSDYRFAIESISKVVTMALALEDVGAAEVQKKIGADPTGLPFNSVLAIEIDNGRPNSPLVNAGAMSAVSLIKGKSANERWNRILEMQRALGSPAIALSDEVNKSEQDTNFHNRGIAYLLYSYGYMYSDPMEACDVYTRQCSTLVSAVDLATIGATLAAGGVNPVSGKRVLSAENVPPILAQMTMEGLYEHSGDWAYTVGLPAKSGVGGGIMAVVPGVCGIAGFAPPLDEAGNSVRAQAMVTEVAQKMGFNVYKP